MEDWQTVAVETEMMIEGDAATSKRPQETSKGCGCLYPLLFGIIGIALFRLLALFFGSK